MPRFITVVTVMLSSKFRSKSYLESVTASHQVNHSGHILHHTEAVGQLAPSVNPMGLVPRTICLTGLGRISAPSCTDVYSWQRASSNRHNHPYVPTLFLPFKANTIIIQSKLQGTRHGLVCTIGSYVSFVQIVGQSTTCFVLPVPKCSVAPFALIVIEWRLHEHPCGWLCRPAPRHSYRGKTVHVGISNDCIRMGTNHDIGVSGVGPFRNPAAFLIHLYQRGYHVINTFRSY